MYMLYYHKPFIHTYTKIAFLVDRYNHIKRSGSFHCKMMMDCIKGCFVFINKYMRDPIHRIYDKQTFPPDCPPVLIKVNVFLDFVNSVFVDYHPLTLSECALKDI